MCQVYCKLEFILYFSIQIACLQCSQWTLDNFCGGPYHLVTLMDLIILKLIKDSEITILPFRLNFSLHKT